MIPKIAKSPALLYLAATVKLFLIHSFLRSSLHDPTNPTEDSPVGVKWFPSKFEEIPSFSSDVSLNTTRYKIFQIETSRVTNLRPRYLCSIESYCRHNPDAIVWLLLLEWEERKNSTWEEVTDLQQRYANLRLARFNMDDLLEGTPMTAIAKDHIIYESVHLANKLSNIARLAVVWKYGGFYSDLDVLCFKDITSLTDVLIMENKYGINQSTFHLSAENPMLWLIMDSMNANYKNEEWGAIGPTLVTNTYERHCPHLNPIRLSPDMEELKREEQNSPKTATREVFNRRSLLSRVTRSAHERLVVKRSLYRLSNNLSACRSVVVLHHQVLAPILYDDVQAVFQFNATVNVDKILMQSFGVHFYNYKTNDMTAIAGSGVLMDALAQVNCPRVYTTTHDRRDSY